MSERRVSEEFTDLGHDIRADGLGFKLYVRAVVWMDKDGVKGFHTVDRQLAYLEIIGPVSQMDAMRVVTNWVGAYGDPQLVARAQRLVDDVFRTLPAYPPSKPVERARN